MNKPGTIRAAIQAAGQAADEAAGAHVPRHVIQAALHAFHADLADAPPRYVAAQWQDGRAVHVWISPYDMRAIAETVAR